MERTIISLTDLRTTHEEEAEVMVGIMRNQHLRHNTGKPSTQPCVGVTFASTIELETANVVAVVGTYTCTNKNY